jgi:ABC-type multidrug transport system fused ATPase/permease subunit
VVEAGTHRELLAANNFYHRYYNLQHSVALSSPRT